MCTTLIEVEQERVEVATCDCGGDHGPAECPDAVLVVEDIDEVLACLDEMDEPEVERLKKLGAPPWLWADLHVCVSNDDGVCERCLHPRVGV